MLGVALSHRYALEGSLQMEVLSKLYVRIREFHKNLSKGQTMTEYALIIAAVAVVVFVTYQVMGQDIIHLITWEVDNDLGAAS
jgi:Flp pilus assembly pilin Flp